MLKSTHGLIHELEARSPHIAAMGLTGKVADDPLEGKIINLANSPRDLDRCPGAVGHLIASAQLSPGDADKMVRLLISSRHFYGAYSELSVYEWLGRHQVDFTAQVPLTGQDVLNPNGCDIDGRFDSVGAYFDIKGFGFQEHVMEQFRERLKARLPGLDVLIEGPSDIAVKDIEQYAFGRLGTLATSLANGGHEQIPELGWTVRAQKPQGVTISVLTHDPYQLAEQNRYYPFKTASQFTRNAPFVLVFPYASQFNLSLAVNFVDSTDISLRALARRAFIQLTGDATPLKVHDAQVAPATTVADAAKLLSGLFFLDLDKDEGQLFLNPRAAHPLSTRDVAEIFDFNVPVGVEVEDFAHDDY